MCVRPKLPELRLAFSYFTPMEQDRIARRAAALHGRRGETLRGAPVSPQAYTRAEALDAWAAARLNAPAPEEEQQDAE